MRLWHFMRVLNFSLGAHSKSTILRMKRGIGLLKSQKANKKLNRRRRGGSVIYYEIIDQTTGKVASVIAQACPN